MPLLPHELRHGAVSLGWCGRVGVEGLQHDAGHTWAVAAADTYQHVFAETAHTAVARTAALLLWHAKLWMSLAGSSQA